VGTPGDDLPPVYWQILGPRTHPIVGTWLPGGLNYAVPEVRAYRLAQFREVLERYDVDGLDLDFQRFPCYFKPGEERTHRGVMTQFMREIRELTNEIAARRGKPLLLTARVLAVPEQNLAVGLDPVTWAHEGLLDFVTVSHYLRNDFTLPVSEWRKALPHGMPIYASVEYEPFPWPYRHLARQLYAEGADGLMLFNFFARRESGRKEPYTFLFKELGDPDTILGPLPHFQRPDFSTREAPVLLVVNKHEDSLSYVDPHTLEELDRIPTGHDPHELVITPNQRFAYISNYAPPGDSVSVIDLVEGRQAAQIPTGAYRRIHSAAITPDGQYAYFTAGQTGYVVEIDTAANEVTRGIPTHGEISHMVMVSPDARTLYTANIVSENVSVIDRESGGLITQVPCEAGCEGLMFTPDGLHLWAANQNAGTITIIDTATHQVTETISVPGVPLRIKFTEDGSRALVTSWETEGELVVIDVASRSEIKRIPVGNQPIGIEISPDGERAYVTNMSSDEVHVIAMDTLEVIDRFETGKGVDAMAWWRPPGSTR
jgi:YVTN family beta-propeller protein